jgi:hypothetical protein
MKRFDTLLAILMAAVSVTAYADTFTMTSPAGGVLPSGVSPVGGLVVDLVGFNGVRITAQASAASEFIGYVPGYTGASTPNTAYLLFAQQTGINSSVVSALGGGIASASFRITLYDGDNQAGNFDFNQDSLYIGGAGTSIGTKSLTSTGVDFGNFSSQTTQQTSGTGTQISANTLGFGNDILDTGFFSSNDPATLAALYSSLLSTSLGTQTLNFQLRDNTYGDQYYDFTQGVDASLVNVGSGPTINPTVTPEPSSLVLLGTGALGLVGVVRRKFLNA